MSFDESREDIQCKISKHLSESSDAADFSWTVYPHILLRTYKQNTKKRGQNK